MNPLFPEVPRYTVDALGIHTSYLMLGDRNSEPLILLHGMSTAADSFRETIVGLADEFWLLAPDIPGFGYSDNTRPYTYAHLVEWLASFSIALSNDRSATSFLSREFSFSRSFNLFACSTCIPPYSLRQR